MNKLLLSLLLLSACGEQQTNKCVVRYETGTELMLIVNPDGSVSQYPYPTYVEIDTCKQRTK